MSFAGWRVKSGKNRRVAELKTVGDDGVIVQIYKPRK
jgi:hypothetical protein